MPSIANTVPEERAQEKVAKKFVEASAEMELSGPVHLVEKEESPRQGDSQPDVEGKPLVPQQAEVVSSDQISGQGPVIQSPGNFVKLNVLNTALFLIFPSACCATAILCDPRITGNMYCRTAFLCAFIWNLIGGVIFAQSRKAWERRIVFWLFAMPFALSGIVCSAFFPILMGLMQHLPPNLK